MQLSMLSKAQSTPLVFLLSPACLPGGSLLAHACPETLQTLFGMHAYEKKHQNKLGSNVKRGVRTPGRIWHWAWLEQLQSVPPAASTTVNKEKKHIGATPDMLHMPLTYQCCAGPPRRMR
eukprot:scaffold52594_cov19-Tisochrysis_lutea.AAC.2